MTIDEVLKVKQLDYYINPEEFIFFVNRKKDADDLKIIFQTDMSEYIYIKGIENAKIDCFNPHNSDAYVTALQSQVLKQIISLNKTKINSTNLQLFLGGLSQKYLTWIIDAENGRHKGRDEFCYSDGEIVVIDGNKVTTNNPQISYETIKSRLAEGILITSSQLSNIRKPINTSGTYIKRGIDGQTPVREIFNSEELKKFAKTKEVISSLDKNKFVEYIEKGIIKKWDVKKYIDKNFLPADVSIDLMIANIFSKKDVYDILEIKTESQMPSCKKINFASKLLLYSAGKMKIEDLEKAAKYEEELGGIKLNSEQVKKVSQYYKGNINKISELLTHNVLDFSTSMSFLGALVQESAITEEDKNYLVDIMNDFKTAELLNETENARLETEGNGISGPKTYTNGVTIDPNIRKNYFKSIGNVKEIFIKGERLISDDSEGATQKNSLDGYQLIIIPDKKIAVLEKFYEVTRNKEGKIEYKKDKNGNLIPATEQATYIMPIGMAKDFAEKKNKQELINSPYVSRTFHTMNWVKNTEETMQRVAQRAGLQIEFDRENTQKWSEQVKENYKILKQQRMKNFDEL